MNAREIFRTNILEILHFSDKTSSFASMKSTTAQVDDEHENNIAESSLRENSTIVEQRLPSPFDDAFADNGQIIMASNVGVDGAITLAVVVRKMNMFLSTSNVYVCCQQDQTSNENNNNKKSASAAAAGAGALRKFNLINSHCDG